jgi:hypothetical protein
LTGEIEDWDGLDEDRKGTWRLVRGTTILGMAQIRLESARVRALPRAFVGINQLLAYPTCRISPGAPSNVYLTGVPCSTKLDRWTSHTRGERFL